MPAPTYEQWAAYCFERGYAEFRNGEEQDDTNDYLSIAPPTLAEYLLRLFNDAENWRERYTVDQIAKAVWFIYGVGSCYFTDLRDGAVPREVLREVIRASSRMYRELFDRLCNGMGKVPDDHCEDAIDTAVHMIWDMDNFDGAALEAGMDVCIEVIKMALNCRTSSCKMSGLHGLGHLHMSDPKRVEQTVDWFLSRYRQLPEWLVDYAHQARSGMVL